MSTGPSKRMRGRSRGPLAVVSDAQHLRAHPVAVTGVGLETEDDRADLPDRLVEVVDDHRKSLPMFGVGGARGDGLDHHPRGEELLDHDVMEVTGDALTVLDHPEMLLGLTQAFVGRDSFANVTDDLHVANDGAVVVPNRLHQDLDRDVGTVTVAMNRREHQRRLLAPRERTEHLAGARAR